MSRRLRLSGSILLLAGGLAAVLGAAAIAGPGSAGRSKKLAPRLCETTGGGRFVPIPGFAGERIDRRLLADIRWLEKRYSIFITDGYSVDPVHASNGEHPLGLALDIAPNTAAGGSWSSIDRLARWAEPRQNRPRQPFRWVGYNGDGGHGRGNHLHLSWSHSVATRGPGHPVRTVFTIRCPRGAGSGPSPESSPPDGGVKVHGPAGSDSGGVATRPRLAAPVVETGGMRARDQR